MIPGFILQYNTEYTYFYGLETIFWFGVGSSLVFLYPVIRSVSILVADVLIPDRFYEGKNGDRWYYSMVTVRNLVFPMWIAVVWIVWSVVYGQIIKKDLPIAITNPLGYVQPVFGVLLLWSMAMGLKQVLMQYWVERFRCSTYVERMRISLLSSFVIEALKEFKRKLKYRKKLQEELHASLPDIALSPVTSNGGSENDNVLSENVLLGKRPDSKESQPVVSIFSDPSREIKERFRYLSLPTSLMDAAVTVNPKTTPDSMAGDGNLISSYLWQCLTEHFTELLQKEEQQLKDIEIQKTASIGANATHRNSLESDDYIEHLIPLKRKKYGIYINKLDSSTNARHGIFRLKKLRASHRVKTDTKDLDVRSAKLASKLFKLLRSSERKDSLDVDRDVMPVFAPVPHKFKISKHSSNIPDERLDQKEKEISDAIRIALKKASENGKLSEQSLKDFIYHSEHEKKRLLESLHGMNSAIQRVITFQDFMLFVVLILITVSIFNSSAFNSLSSISSVILSFTFLFGSTAKTVFENIIFIFFIHPYDVGDRLLINNKTYVVTKIYLLTTLLESFDGQLEYVANTHLATMDIYNIRRSRPCCDGYKVNFAFETTTTAQLLKLQEKLTEYTHNPNNSDFSGKVGININGVFDMENLIVTYYATQRGTKQNWDLYLARKTKFMAKIIEQCEALNIEWRPLPKYIELQDLRQDSEPKIM